MDIKNVILAALAGVGSVIANALGGWDAALAVLIGFMAADYVTGLLVALVWHVSPKSSTGTFTSHESFKGLIRKLLILVIVWIGAMLDSVLGAAYIRMAVVLFFIANEGLSILENTALMGVPYPKFVKQALEALQKNSDEASDKNES